MIIRATKLVGVLACAFVAALAMPAAKAAGQGQTSPTGPTFTKDVLPILQRSCQKCHRPGTAAPMSLLSYQDVRPWARSIRQKVSTRQMPPWHIDRSIGEYLEDPSLSDEQIATIVAWIDNGLPQGNPADAPPPLQFSARDEWTYGEPDLVVEMKNGFTIPATGPDFTPSEVVDPGITEDRYVKWVQIIPQAWRTVHHSHVYVSMLEGTDTTGLQLGMGSNRDDELDLIEYGAGNDADVFPDGTAKVIKAGSLFRFSSHYHPYGEEVHDRQKVGIKFYPKGVVPKYVVESHRIRTGQGNDWIMQREKVEDLLLRKGVKLDIDEPTMPTGALIDENSIGGLGNYSIPPNSVARTERYWTLPQPALIISFQPHMHFRGGRMLIEAIHADGRREVLTDATRYEQSWQITYKYKVPHLFPSGTILHTVAWHDNTTNNRHNPDPTSWIGAGSRTMDEMGHAWTDLAFLTDEQYQEELAKRQGQRKQTQTTAGGQQQ
jgi:mono/diheme cytochrome c family protein